MNQFTCTSPQCGSGRPRDEHPMCETSQAVTLDSRDRTGRVRVRIVSRQGSSGKARSAARIVSARAIESSHPAHIIAPTEGTNHRKDAGVASARAHLSAQQVAATQANSSEPSYFIALPSSPQNQNQSKQTPRTRLAFEALHQRAHMPQCTGSSRRMRAARTHNHA